MPKQVGFPQNFYIGGRDISGDVGSIGNCSAPRPLLDVTGINQSAIQRVNGLADGLMDWSVWFNDAAGQEHLALRGLPTTDVIVLYANRATRAAAAAGLVAKQLHYDWARGADGSLQGSVSAHANAVPIEWGEMLTAGMITDASAANGTSIDNGTATSNGLAGYLELASLATGTVTIVIQESSDDGAVDPYTTKLAFTAVAAASAPTAERLTATGTVKRYLRVASTGTFTNARYAVMARRGTAQDDTAY